MRSLKSELAKLTGSVAYSAPSGGKGSTYVLTYKTATADLARTAITDCGLLTTNHFAHPKSARPDQGRKAPCELATRTLHCYI
jgi:hypothetical protein